MNSLTQVKLSHPHSRQPAGITQANPLLTLDLVPTGKPGEIRAYFRGQPLGGIKAVLPAPDKDEREVTADADGFIRFKAEKPGQYLLTVAHHREPLSGFHHGRAYEQTGHNAAFIWRQP